MPKKWNEDRALVDSVAMNLFEMLPLFPKGIVHMDEIVRAHQMPFSHIQILVMLAGENLSIGQISQRLGIAKPNITPLVDVMRDSGLVERVRSQTDRRIVHVRLLEAGKEKLEAIRSDIAEQVAAWKGGLSRSEIKELNNAMASIIRIAGSING
ncbi:MAG: winged helix-turn-helix transcriptional regulator [Clostridia bacterium]|nr:winged helix-turn-helix transcriptional regulator [Clostridia bacterium]